MKIEIVVILIAAILITTYLDTIVGMVIFFAAAIGLVLTKKTTGREAALAAVLFLIFFQMSYLYYQPALQVARGQGTVLSDNWWQGLNWINQNTSDFSLIATYWDPGHFITGIARRAVVFDGASQSNLFIRPYNYTLGGLVVDKYDANINHIILYSNGNKTTARIQDISTTLLTANETLAVEILKEYRKPGCDEMYYIASADLIPKSTWWTYFSTWNPVDKRGTPYVYSSIPLGNARQDPTRNAVVYSYPVSQQETFILYVTNGTLLAFLQRQGNSQPLRVEKYIYFDEQGRGQLITQEDAQIKGLLYIDPGFNSILFIPPELENAMFTRMFLFNGAGLENFEYVNSWGGEVKLFKVKFDG